MDRRTFLGQLAAGAALGSTAGRAVAAPATSLADWTAVRNEFLLDRTRIHLALMLLTSHPRPVREAIELHRRKLDENPVDYFEEKFGKAEAEVRAAAAR